MPAAGELQGRTLETSLCGEEGLAPMPGEPGWLCALMTAPSRRRGQPGGLNTTKERVASVLASKHSNEMLFVMYTRQRDDREPLLGVGWRCRGQGARQPTR